LLGIPYNMASGQLLPRTTAS